MQGWWLSYSSKTDLNMLTYLVSSTQQAAQAQSEKFEKFRYYMIWPNCYTEHEKKHELYVKFTF